MFDDARIVNGSDRIRPGRLCEPPSADPRWGRKTPGYPIGTFHSLVSYQDAVHKELRMASLITGTNGGATLSVLSQAS